MHLFTILWHGESCPISQDRPLTQTLARVGIGANTDQTANTRRNDRYKIFVVVTSRMEETNEAMAGSMDRRDCADAFNLCHCRVRPGRFEDRAAPAHDWPLHLNRAPGGGRREALYAAER